MTPCPTICHFFPLLTYHFADCMDEDIEEALFGEEDGAFEELNDDFILQAGQEPDEDQPDNGGEEAFDFEAHMARLIEKSENSMGWAPARGWEDGELEKLERVRTMSAVSSLSFTPACAKHTKKFSLHICTYS